MQDNENGPYGWQPTPAPVQAATMPHPEANMARFRRYAAAVVLAIGLIAGGSAVVMAASPDPSATPTPQATDGSGSGSGGTTDDGTTAPSGDHPCPKDGSGSGSGTDSGSDSGTSTDSIDATAL
jgi:hypothetical protein